VKNRISRRTGSEGPRHDPYHYEELTVEGRNGTTTVHMGLGEWIQNNKGPKVRIEGKELDSVFQAYTGIGIHTAIKLYEQRPWRKHSRICSGKDTETVHGYPGETLEVCCKCGQVVTSHMNFSAIE
jgi:hypothetical protein